MQINLSRFKMLLILGLALLACGSAPPSSSNASAGPRLVVQYRQTIDDKIHITVICDTAHGTLIYHTDSGTIAAFGENRGVFC